MKKLISSFLIVLFVAGSMVYGQEPASNSPAQLAARSTASLTKTLNLNQDQQQAVLCAQEDFFLFKKQLIAKHAVTGGPSDGLRLQLHHKRQACQQKIFALLTPAQAEAYERYLSGLRPR